MDIRFDAKEAELLIRQMDAYCKDVAKETKSLLDLTGAGGEWKDTQQKAFQNNTAELAKDLKHALDLEADYMRTFQQRVVELRG